MEHFSHVHDELVLHGPFRVVDTGGLVHQEEDVCWLLLALHAAGTHRVLVETDRELHIASYERHPATSITSSYTGSRGSKSLRSSHLRLMLLLFLWISR